MNHLKLIPLEERIVLDAAVAATAAHVLYVSASAANGGDGTLAHPFNHLQDALSLSQSLTGPNQIDVAKGTYYPTTGTDRTATFSVPNNTTILGGFNTKFNQRNPSVNSTILSGDIGVLGTNSDNSFNVVTIGTPTGTVSLPSETVTLDGLTITGAYNNSTGTDGGSGGTGGGLLILNANGSTVTLSDMTFINDSATLQGGAIFATGVNSLNIMDSHFLNNSVLGTGPNGGAITVTSSQTLTIADSDFNGNQAIGGVGAGGAIFTFRDISVTITSSTFEHNTAGDGGAVFLRQDTNDSVTSTIFTQNSGDGSDFTGGGALVVHGSMSAVTISHNLFVGNSSSSPLNHGDSGGAINLANNKSLVDVTYNSFIDNTADQGGAIIAAPNVKMLNVAYNSFIDNSATAGALGDGGAILTAANGSTSSINIQNNLFLGNTASDSGGALNLGDGAADGTVNVANNLFLKNSASNLGGAIASSHEINLVIDNNLLANNSAMDGGAIADLSSVSVSIMDNVFGGHSNSATQGNSVWLDGKEGSVNGVSPATNPMQVIMDLVDNNHALFSEDILIA